MALGGSLRGRKDWPGTVGFVGVGAVVCVQAGLDAASCLRLARSSGLTVGMSRAARTSCR